MSDTTSFLGGAALAGLAAVIVLRGGINLALPTVSSPNAARLPMPPSLPPVGNATQDFATANPALPNPQPAIAKAELGYEEAKLRLEMDQLKSQFEQQQQQIRNQQTLIDNLTLQAKAQSLTPPAPVPQPTAQAPAPRRDESSLAAGLPWALGGVLLTFGGGIALVGIMSMFTTRQNRPVRTVEYVHDDYSAYVPSRRRTQQVLPPRRTLRRVDLEDVE